jgi:hypothetical protein
MAGITLAGATAMMFQAPDAAYYTFLASTMSLAAVTLTGVLKS